LACAFINAFADACGEDSEEAIEILDQIFIQREHVTIDGRKQKFAQIVVDIPSAHGQASVLKTLTERFPDAPHFWNHRGRHSAFSLSESYSIAEGYLKKAIHLQPDDSLHHHTLGMVYRVEVRRILKNSVKNRDLRAGLANVFEQLRPFVTLAESSFERAREIDPDNEHGYVANIQMTFSVIDELMKLSGETDYPSFFKSSNEVATWLRAKLEKSKELLDRIRGIQGRDRSSYVNECAAKFRGFMGDYEAMMSGLNELLESSKENRATVRRIIADCIRNHHQDNWSRLSEKNLQRIRELSMSNIQYGGATHRDYVSWFQAYRRQAGFDYNEAISVMDSWYANTNSVDASYHLFVLHFVKWYRGLTTDLTNASRHLARIVGASYGRVHSYEWLAKPIGRNISGLVHESELGAWSAGIDGHRFFESTEPMLRVQGVVTNLRDARSGFITIYSTTSSGSGKKMDAFFVPGIDFVKGRDENTVITAYLGFSYSGLRAWVVKRL
jgi:tetratricopeptide (TPR) repeat protein